VRQAAFEGPRARAIIVVLLGRALRRPAVAAPTDGRCSGGFKPEATVAARHADAAEGRCSVPDKPTFHEMPGSQTASSRGGTSRESSTPFPDPERTGTTRLLA